MAPPILSVCTWIVIAAGLALPRAASAQGRRGAQSVRPPTSAVSTIPARGSNLTADDPALSGAGRAVVTIPRTSQPPLIDGRLDDAVWRDAARITHFVQQRPREGEPATEATEVLIAYDVNNLYFGIDVHYSTVGIRRANHVDRDRLWSDDTVSVIFDPFRDQQRGYLFAVNGYGVEGDALLASGGGRGRGPGGGGPGGGGPGGGGPPGDPSWDALFQAAGVLTDHGWTAEMAIPFKSLRYPGGVNGALPPWGFQIQRTIQSKNENDVWAPVSRDIPGLLRQLGTLTGLQDISSSHNFEIQPTATAIDTTALDTTSGRYAGSGTHNAGANIRYGITPNLTLDTTLNPDFSQVESDNPQIATNQRYPLFYPERRPFFLEGQEAFDVQAPVRVIDTRTIARPRYGAKLTGKIGRTLLGVLVTNDDSAGDVADRADPAFGRSARVLAARARYDVYANSYVGAIVTDREFLGTFSRLAGVDGSFQFGPNRQVSVVALASTRGGGGQAGLAGRLFNAQFQQRGRHLRYGFSYGDVDPNFGTDVGFVRRTDTRQVGGQASYRWWPSTWILNWGPSLGVERIGDHAGVTQNRDVNGGIDVQFADNINASVNYDRGMERYADIDFPVSSWSISGGISASRAISFRGRLGGGRQIRYVDDPFTGTSASANLSLVLRPFSRLESQVTLTSSRLVNPYTALNEFNVKIWRARTTYQFTQRLLARNITQYNTQDGTFDANLLVTYRVNSGTALFVGYDDHYQQGNQIDASLFATPSWQRTNRAVFAKVQYLLRY